MAMISVSALAFGYLIMNLFATSSNLSGDVCSTLFGSTSILTLQVRDVWMCVILSIVMEGVFDTYTEGEFTYCTLKDAVILEA